MKRAFSMLYWLWVGVVAIAVFPVALFVWAVTRPFDRRRAFNHALTNLWASLYTWCNPLWTVRVRGREHFDRDSTYVMVCNHLSLVDIFVLHRLHRHFSWVSKEENFRIPVIGWNMRLCRYIPLRRGDTNSVQAMFARCRLALARGSSIMMFPEGTRSRDGSLQPFKPGAFELAKQARVSILPVVVQGTYEALEPRSFEISRARMRVTVLRAIPDDEVEALRVDELTALVHGRIDDHLKQRPWPPPRPRDLGH